MDNEPSFQKKAIVALIKPTQVLKDPTVVDDLAAGSTTEQVKHVLAKTRPKMKPASGHPALSATTHVPITKTSKLTSKLNCSNNSDIDVKNQKLPQPSMSKLKSSEPKTEAAKVKEALRDVQETFKKVREEVRRVKENMKEPGVHNRIKVLNKGANAKPGQFQNSIARKGLTMWIFSTLGLTMIMMQWISMMLSWLKRSMVVALVKKQV